MSDESPMDEVTDLIASVEMHRKEIEKEAGLEASREYALRRLRQRSHEEQEASRQSGASPVRIAIAEILAAEIRRVEALTRNRPQLPQNARQGPQRAFQRPAGRPPKPRNRRR